MSKNKKSTGGITDFDLGDTFSEEPSSKEATTAKKHGAEAVETDTVKTIGVVFRMKPSDWKKIKDLGTAKRLSLQDVLELSVDKYLRDLGLPSIHGIKLDKLKQKGLVS